MEGKSYDTSPQVEGIEMGLWAEQLSIDEIEALATDLDKQVPPVLDGITASMTVYDIERKYNERVFHRGPNDKYSRVEDEDKISDDTLTIVHPVSSSGEHPNEKYIVYLSGSHELFDNPHQAPLTYDRSHKRFTITIEFPEGHKALDFGANTTEPVTNHAVRIASYGDYRVLTDEGKNVLRQQLLQNLQSNLDMGRLFGDKKKRIEAILTSIE